jgi:hypothetical protein
LTRFTDPLFDPDMKQFVPFCFVLLVFAGCTDKSPGLAATAKVAGSVTLDGKPMEGGEVRFVIPGQPPQSIPVQGGNFSGEAYVGSNRVEVLWEKDGPPHPMDPMQRLKVNTVDAKFSGPESSLKAEVSAGGASDLKFEVTSAGG